MVEARYQPHRSVEVFALDVGQGDATLILPPDGHEPILFDCADDWVVTKVLDNWGIRSLSAVIASHLDRDHVGGMEGFLKSFTGSGGQVPRVFISRDRPIADTDHGAILAKSLIDYVTTEELERRRWRVYPAVAPHMPIAHGVDWSIRLIAPTQAMELELERTGTRAPPNLLSGVLRIEIGNHAAIIGGDAQLRAWALLPPEELRARVFRIPHHGGDLSKGGVPEGWDAARLYEAVQPEVAVLSVGRGHDHPDLDWIRPVTGGGACRLVCTQVTPHCEPAMSKQPPALRTSAIQSPHFVEPPWRHLDPLDRPRRDRYEIPCAGTVVIELRDDGELRVLPQHEGPHRRLVDGWRSPRCRPDLV